MCTVSSLKCKNFEHFCVSLERLYPYSNDPSLLGHRINLFSGKTWNLFVLYNNEFKKILMMTSSIRLSSNRS